MADEPDNMVLRMLREMREQMVTKNDLVDVGVATESGPRHQVRTALADTERRIRADVASDLIVTRKELSEQIVGLRRAVVEYHSTTVGHGILISELEARVRRVEQHLNLPPLASH